jgi:hypothetical protein
LVRFCESARVLNPAPGQPGPAESNFGSANFGRIFGAKNPREMQLGVRLAV